MHKLLYLGLDAHTRGCVLAAMNAAGRLLYTKAFATSEAALVRHVVEAPAREKRLVLEESALAGWIADALRPYVDELIVCDPRQNALMATRTITPMPTSSAGCCAWVNWLRCTIVIRGTALTSRSRCSSTWPSGATKPA